MKAAGVVLLGGAVVVYVVLQLVSLLSKYRRGAVQVAEGVDPLVEVQET